MMTDLEQDYNEVCWDLVNLEDTAYKDRATFEKEFHLIVMRMIEINGKFSYRQKEFDRWASKEEKILIGKGGN